MKSSQGYGYMLFASTPKTITYLIDTTGAVVHSWSSNYRPGAKAEILDNGNLLRAGLDESNTVFSNQGAAGGIIEIFDWDGDLIWQYFYSTNTTIQHHDVINLPNGNILFPAWEIKFEDEIIAIGRNSTLMQTTYMYFDAIIEVEPTGSNTGEIVWEWRSWDHLIQDYCSTCSNYGVVSNHPELLDLNYNNVFDFTHVNALDYHEELDQLMLSLHTQGEFIIIDHSTTTSEAASHSGGRSGVGGDILYRWGNPQVYGRGNISNQQLNGQHDAHWISNDVPSFTDYDVLVFDNRCDPKLQVSCLKQVQLPTPNDNGTYNLSYIYAPDSASWTYQIPNFVQNMGGLQRTEDGHTFFCEANDPSYFYEINNNETVVWEFNNTQGPAFRSPWYSPTYSGFNNRTFNSC